MEQKIPKGPYPTWKTGQMGACLVREEEHLYKVRRRLEPNTSVFRTSNAERVPSG
jgi:hypothetical protein